MRAIGLLALFLMAVVANERPLRMTVTPHVCQAPCSVRVDVHVTPHALNRWLVVVIDGTTLQATSRELEGEQGRLPEPVWFRSLPEGEYVVVAVVYRATDPSEAGRVTQTVLVE